MSLRQAITAIKAGDKQAGKQLLAKVLKADPRNEQAWLWMTEVVDRDEDRLKFLRNVLKINPNNETVKRKLAALQRPKDAPQRQTDAPQRQTDAPQWPKAAPQQQKDAPKPEEEEEPAKPDYSPSASALSLPIAKGMLVIDGDNERVMLDGEPLQLSPVELELLVELAQNKGQVVTYEHLLTQVWGIPTSKQTQVSRKNIEKYIYFLRRRLEEDLTNPTLILHEEGAGYRLG